MILLIAQGLIVNFATSSVDSCLFGEKNKGNFSCGGFSDFAPLIRTFICSFGQMQTRILVKCDEYTQLGVNLLDKITEWYYSRSRKENI